MMMMMVSPFEVQRPRAFVVSVTDTGLLLPRLLLWAQYNSSNGDDDVGVGDGDGDGGFIRVFIWV